MNCAISVCPDPQLHDPTHNVCTHKSSALFLTKPAMGSRAVSNPRPFWDKLDIGGSRLRRAIAEATSLVVREGTLLACGGIPTATYTKRLWL